MTIDGKKAQRCEGEWHRCRSLNCRSIMQCIEHLEAGSLAGRFDAGDQSGSHQGDRHKDNHLGKAVLPRVKGE